MPPKSHRRSDKERRAADVKAAAKRNEVKPPKPRPKSRLPPRATGNPLVDYLQAQTPARMAALVDAASRGQITREHIQAAMASELGTVVEAMRDNPEAFRASRPGYSIRRDILAKMIELTDSEAQAGDIQVVVRWPAPVGPPGGDQVRVSRAGATTPEGGAA